ncbi:MAG: hypothetical protein M3Q69_11700 [Acidobacteriota bacterium]|nr:hypothetical protein [Acidobacteriota bacterium]
MRHAHGTHETAPVEMFECRLHAAAREAGFIGNVLMAGDDAFPARAERPIPQMKIDDVGRGGFVMPDQIGEQSLQNVEIEADGLRFCGYDSNDYSDNSSR